MPDEREHLHGDTLVEDDPQVILDFELDDGLLFAVVANIADTPARDVHVHFDRAFHGAGGRDLRELAAASRCSRRSTSAQRGST